MSNLKPCPFCGTSNCEIVSNGHDSQFVECMFCGASGPAHETHDETTEAWNRRAQPAQADNLEAGKSRFYPAQAEPKVKESHFAPQEAVTEDGWTEWICPKPTGYLAQCCDCDLVHEIDTRVVKYEPRPSENFEVVSDPDLQVQWRVRRRDDLKSPENRVFEIRGNPAFEPAQAVPLLTKEEMLRAVRHTCHAESEARALVEISIDEYRAIEQAVRAKMGVAVPMTTRRVTYTCPACHFSLERQE